MKVRDRIDVITDLLLGAVFADARMSGEEHEAVRALLADLLLVKELPDSVEARIAAFDPARFDLRAAAADFASDPPMNRRRLLELVARLCAADGALDLAEDDYVRALADALEMAPEEYRDLVLDYEIEELRRSFEAVRMTPAEGVRRPRIVPPTPPSGVRR